MFKCCIMLLYDFLNILFKFEKVMLFFLIYLIFEDNGLKKFFGVYFIGFKNFVILGYYIYFSIEFG